MSIDASLDPSLDTSLVKSVSHRTPDADDQYRALLRSLRRRKGFGLIFIQAAPAKATELIAQVRQDLPQKHIEVLQLEQPIDKLLPLIEQLPDRDKINILFIQGIERSLTDYIRPGYGGQGDYYTLDTVPPILSHLNQQRDSLRDRFPHLCFVFVLPRFALKFFIHRAPDFFDWRAGIYDFPSDGEILMQSSEQVLAAGDYNQYLSLTHAERLDQIHAIQALLDEPSLPVNKRVSLWLEQGLVWAADRAHELALTCFNQAIHYKPDYHEAWYNRGKALSALRRKEEAISSYDHAIGIKPDYHEAWYNRGNALSALGRKEEAISSYDHALAIKPDLHAAWNNRGNALSALGRKEEAISSYDHAIGIKPDYHEAWNNRGNALSALGRKEEAISSYDHALAIKPDKYNAWDNRGDVLQELGRYEDALASYDRAIALKPDYHFPHKGRGTVLMQLGRHDEALTSFDRAIALKPDYAAAYYNKARCLALQGNIAATVETLQQAIALKPDYRDLAQMEADFDRVRSDERFQSLIEA
ncbi:tetratricopeptide repeat protein [Leptolyngbya sp. NK1-12]|uniref:Tetratricopeptide repeat protein n=1 Tax=Leptolyngbya sp. NK1-12 TaxID=2547451 RepID=A0AA96WIQ3_9CYAN|nr:tetratricopeptide repeat protein [Leptolyngbya sp. NK1-12]WNZ25864.1 tetratricopeptide repeat protein [Leptolyngbya sp. NK1-12]